jgi:hypothetical protein
MFNLWKTKMTKKGTRKSCQCEECKSYCSCKPGWFLPGQAERLAKKMDIPLKQLFSDYLAVDWWEEEGGDIFLLSPALVHGTAGEEFPNDPRGVCIFYKEGLCQIHDKEKPHECQVAFHEDKKLTIHQTTGMAWDKLEYQKQIRDLLGREPVSGSFMIFDMLRLELDSSF